MNAVNTTLRTTTRRLISGALIAGSLFVVACAPLVTQNPGQGWSPANVKSLEGVDRLLLDGHDVVSYFTDNAHKKGSAQFAVVHKGVTLHFSSAANKTKFEASPDQYLPQFGGYCANGVVYGIPWGGDADSFRIVNGKLYIFGGLGSKQAFELDVPANIVLADKYWNEEIKNSNAFLQRTKRTTFAKVPHYKTGSELAAMVAAKQGK
jgi:YHS domain-containing protein